MDTQIIILAAGRGSRMQSDLPKVMHQVGGRSMLEHVVDNCQQVTRDLILVYSEHLQPFLSLFTNQCKIVEQVQQLGTGHATYAANELMAQDKAIGVIYGDNPLITSTTIRELFAYLERSQSDMVTLVFEHQPPNQYGKIILDTDGNFLKIVEAKYATQEQQQITLCNSGIMVFAPGVLAKYLPNCLQAQEEGRELYLTDIIEFCQQAGGKVGYYKTDTHQNVVGVNTQDELAQANKLYQQKNQLVK